MADSTLTALAAATALDGTELYYVVQGGVDAKATGMQVSTIAGVVGETGVINPKYAVGDVRRYGITPDGVDFTGLGFTSGSGTITGAPGTFTAAMVGMSICSPYVGVYGVSPPQISSVAGDGSSCVMSGGILANATASGQGARIGTYWGGSKITAVLANAVLPTVTIYWPPGKYVMGFNLNGAASNNTKMFFDNAEFSDIVHLISTVDKVVMAGKITCYDRFGAIGLTNFDLSKLYVNCRSDPTKSVYGIRGRGVHIYSMLQNGTFGNFEIDDCVIGTVYNTDAAFSMDSSDCVNINFSGRIWVKDCDGHAV